MKRISLLAVMIALALIAVGRVHAQSGGTFELEGAAGQPDAAAPASTSTGRRVTTGVAQYC